MRPSRAEERETILAQGRWERAVAILSRLDPTVRADAFQSLSCEHQEHLFRRLPVAVAAKMAALRLSELERWRRLLLPAIFPYLITGFVTASGGAWNASIIAEYFRFRGQTFTTAGLGAIISRATDAGNFPVLLAATIVISIMVVTINRLLWRRLYALASSRFALELT